MNAITTKDITGLYFDDGLKSYTINNDENRIIRFNPSDANILDRCLKVEKEMDKIIKSIPEDIDISKDYNKANTIVQELNERVREQLNFLLNSDCYDAIFNGMSPFSPVNGQIMLVGVVSGITDLINAAASNEEKAIKNAVKKYGKA